MNANRVTVERLVSKIGLEQVGGNLFRNANDERSIAVAPLLRAVDVSGRNV